MTEVCIFIPGYADPVLSPEMMSEGQGRFDSIEKSEPAPWQAQLCHALGWVDVASECLPSIVWLEKKLDQGNADLAACLDVHADPIHLKADRDTALVIPSDELQIDSEHADLLIDSLNEFLADDKARFYRRGADSWFLGGLSSDSLKACPTSFVAHRKASAFLPEDDAGGQWRRLMSEIQMLLHTHPVNSVREKQGLLPINSVWFWGNQAQPPVPVSSNDVVLLADEPYAVTLGKYLSVERHSLAKFDTIASIVERLSGQRPSEQRVVILIHALVGSPRQSDPYAYRNQEPQFASRYLDPLLELVQKGVIDKVDLRTEEGLSGTFVKPAAAWWQRLLMLRR
ncbi:MAG: hypothetical protein AB8B63_07905 [Granulosicoccus sp.]